MLLIHRRDVVEPVEIRDRLQIGLLLDQLLGAAMQQPDMRIDALDDLAVKLQHEAQHAVRRRMLRPEIDGEVAHRGSVHGDGFGLLVARQHVVRAFPRRQEIEIAEFLREPHRLVEHALLLVVVAHLDEAGEREILAQRMALEAVVGEQPAHVGMIGEHHAVEVPGLALEPLGAGKHRDDRRNRRHLVGLGLHADARVLLRREEMIDDVEALLARRPVHRGHIDDVPELAARIVAQERRDLHDVGRLCGDRQFAIGDGMPGDRAGQRAHDRFAQCVECLAHQRSIVPVRRIFFCSSITP